MKKVFILFMSHDGGDHGLTVHNTIEEVRESVKTVVDIINEGNEEDNEKYKSDMAIVESIQIDDEENSFYAELSDSTWFDVFLREV